MKANEFQLVNLAGGRAGGVYRLRADGRLPLRAVRALAHAPFGGYHFSGPAAGPAADAWRYLWNEAYAQCVTVFNLI